MLEFWGLEQEAMEVVSACIVIGAAIGLPLASGKTTDEKSSTGQIVFGVICSIRHE